MGLGAGSGPEPEPAIKMWWSLVPRNRPLDLSSPTYQVMG